MRKGGSNVGNSWLHEHVNDHYVHMAKAKGYRSRAAFKLLQIDEKDRLIKPGLCVVDLGAAPGSWSQVLAEKLGERGKVIALDLLPLEPIRNVRFIQGDFRENEVLRKLRDELAGAKVDLVFSDMAPNMSGVELVDQTRVMLLAELTLDFCEKNLKPGGAMLVKTFQGVGFMELRAAVLKMFKTVQVRKPAASRGRSAESFLLAQGKR